MLRLFEVCLLIHFLYLGVSQDLKPAVMASNKDGVVSTDHVWLGFLSCNNSSDQPANGKLEEITIKLMAEITELKRTVDILSQKVQGYHLFDLNCMIYNVRIRLCSCRNDY